MRRQELLSQLLELLELFPFVLQSLRAEFGDNGSGASEERQGMLVSGDNFTISNAQIREAINLCLVSRFWLGSDLRNHANFTSVTMHTNWLGIS